MEGGKGGERIEEGKGRKVKVRNVAFGVPPPTFEQFNHWTE